MRYHKLSAAPSGEPQGRLQDRPDVWHAHLRVGKWQSRGEEAVIQPSTSVVVHLVDLVYFVHLVGLV